MYNYVFVQAPVLKRVLSGFDKGSFQTFQVQLRKTLKRGSKQVVTRQNSKVEPGF